MVLTKEESYSHQNKHCRLEESMLRVGVMVFGDPGFKRMVNLSKNPTTIEVCWWELSIGQTIQILLGRSSSSTYLIKMMLVMRGISFGSQRTGKTLPQPHK